MDAAGDLPVTRLLDRIVRRERSRLVAHLVGRLGGARLDLAEDVTQEALAVALASWPYQGLPDNPAAWLARVARNKAYDRLRRERRELPYDAEIDKRSANPESAPDSTPDQDPELRLIWLCCHNSLSERDRLALTVKIAGGFTTGEVAGLFLTSQEAMARRLTRAKQTLRGSEKELHETPETIDLATRLSSVLKVIYLMFAMGYAPRRGEHAVRSDIAMEALRLARLLAGHAPTATAETAALCALLCFQTSRLAARETVRGEIILLEFQDRGLWDRNLIAEGLGYLQSARKAPVVSRYHLEAGIAATHALAPSWESCDWSAIVRLYGHLETMTRSPVVAINAGVALAMAGDPEAGMTKLDAVSGLPSLQTYAPYFLARAEILARQGNAEAARESWQQALVCPLSEPVAAVIQERLSNPTG